MQHPSDLLRCAISASTHVTHPQFVTLRSIWNDRGRGEGATESTQGSRGTLVEPARGAAGPILAVRNLEVVYQDVVLVLRGVSLELPRGEIVALLGANGAGKTTLLRAVTGLLGVHRGRVTKGSVELDGERISGRDAASIVRKGVAQVMEGRRIFAELTVDENLRAGGFTRSRAEIKEAQDRVFDLFPVLAERRQLHRRLPVRRRAADARHRPRADGRAAGAAARRAVARPRAAAGRAGARHDRRAQPPGRERAAGGAERGDGARHREPRLRDGDRPRGQGRPGGRRCWPTRTSRSSTSASARPAGARSATSSPTGGGSDGAAERPRDGRAGRATSVRPAAARRSSDVTLRFGGVTALDGVSFEVRPGRAVRRDRPQRRRQDLDLQLHQRRLPPAEGLDPARRRGADRPVAAGGRAAGRRAHVPEPRALHAPVGDRQPDARPPPPDAHRLHQRRGLVGPRQARGDRAPRGGRGGRRAARDGGPPPHARRACCRTASRSGSSSAARWPWSRGCCCSTSRWRA